MNLECKHSRHSLFRIFIVGPREACNPNLDSDQWIVYHACAPWSPIATEKHNANRHFGQKLTESFSPVKMCRQPAIWLPTMKYLPLTSHLSDLYSGRRPLQLQPLLPITIVSLPTTQKHFEWAESLPES